MKLNSKKASASGPAAKNFGLTQEQFRSLLEKLRRGDEELFEQVFLVHFDSCVSYIRTKYRASYEDAYDASMEGLLKFHKGLKEGRIQYGNLRYLLTCMASQIYIKASKKHQMVDSMPDGVEELLSATDIPTFSDEVRTAFDRAWTSLAPDSQALLRAFYVEKKRFKEIAAEFQKNEPSIRKQKQRSLQQLQKAFQRFYRTY